MKPWAKWGIGRRLFLAFGCIAATTVVATVVAWLSFGGLSRNIDRFVSEHIPAATLASTLARRSGVITATAPMLAAAETEEERAHARDLLSRSLGEVDVLIAQLDERMLGPEARKTLRALVDALAANLHELDANVRKRLGYRERGEELAERLRWAHADFLDEVEPMIADARFGIELALEQAKGRDGTGNAGRQQRQIRQEILKQEALMQVVASGNLAVGLIARAGDLSDTKAIENTHLYLSEVIARLETELEVVRALPEALSLRQSIEDLRSFANGKNSLFDLRRTELETLANGRRLVEVNRELIGQMQNLFSQRVGAGNAQTLAAAEASRNSVREGRLALIVAAVVSLGVAVLVVWLYVGRSIIARLTALSDSMLAISRGNLEARIPPSGDDEVGAMADALTVFRDTAVEMKQANLREIREARTRLVDAIETIQEGFALYDADDRLVLCNNRYRELLYPGIDDAMVPGAPFEAILRMAVERGMIRDAEGREAEWLLERLTNHREPGGAHFQQHSDGHWIQINERKTESGGTVAVYSDITDLKRAQLEAEAADQAKSRFLAGVSHDLRTPLNAIVGFTRLVMRRTRNDLPPKQYANLEKIEISAGHLHALISDILDYTRAEEIRPAEVVLEGLVDECLRAVEPMVENIRLTKELAPDLPQLFTDERKLKRILINLLSNAVEFTAEGRICVSAQPRDGEVDICVEDTGVGIPQEALARIFNEFEQAHPREMRRTPGTGLGLAICRQFSELIDGCISVRSEVGVGSAFTLTIPVDYRTTTAACGTIGEQATAQHGADLRDNS